MQRWQGHGQSGTANAMRCNEHKCKYEKCLLVWTVGRVGVSARVSWLIALVMRSGKDQQRHRSRESSESRQGATVATAETVWKCNSVSFAFNLQQSRVNSAAQSSSFSTAPPISSPIIMYISVWAPGCACLCVRWHCFCYRWSAQSCRHLDFSLLILISFYARQPLCAALIN